MNKSFTLQLSTAKLNLIGSLIESHKTALDALSGDIQAQVSDQLVAEAAAQQAAHEAATSDVHTTEQEAP